MQREFQYQVNEETRTVMIEPDGDRYRVTVGDQVYTVRASLGDRGRIDMAVEDQRLRAYVTSDKGATYVGLDGQTWTLTKPDPQRTRNSGAAGSEAGALTATMPGLVLDVLVKPGDVVAKGDTLVLMEAMKMELRITAPLDGVIGAVGCAAGQVAERGALLVEMEEEAR